MGKGLGGYLDPLPCAIDTPQNRAPGSYFWDRRRERARLFSAPSLGATPRRLRSPKPVTVLEVHGAAAMPNVREMAREAVRLWRREAARGGMVVLDGDSVSVYTVPGAVRGAEVHFG